MDALLAYQVGFDLVENEMGSFLLKVRPRMSPGGCILMAGHVALDAVTPTTQLVAY